MPDVMVKVLHNLTWQAKRTPFAPYVAGDHLLQVAHFDVAVHAGCVPDLLDFLYERLGDFDALEPWAFDYRRAGHRGLSLGDVVVLGEQAFTRRLGGWEPVTVTTDQVWYDLGTVEPTSDG